MVKLLKRLKFLTITLSAVTFLFSCNLDGGSDTTPDTKDKSTDIESTNVKSNPKPFDKRTDNLNMIFNPDILGETTVTINRSEWDQMLQYYDWWEYNETCVHANFEFTKKDSSGKNYTWQIDDIGLRLRGNTSRTRPQKTNGKGSGDYDQAHFKIDFEEWIEDDTEAKMANCMKGVNLKRFRNDPTYIGEVYCYNTFRANGIKLAPRASYTRLKIKIIEDNSNPEDSETIDFGIYEMVEEINKQFIKERNSSKGGKIFATDTGDLWKCAYAAEEPGEVGNWHGSYMNYGKECPLHSAGCKGETFGKEKKKFIDNEGNYELERYNYDLKTNKSELSRAKTDFQKWLTSLNNLTDGSDDAEKWLDAHFDVDNFLKTYALNVIFGMWDDYWTNGNNFYLYFENEKAYFIPYDYDNVLGITGGGCNINNPATENPLTWGYANCERGTRPLIDKVMSIKAYEEKYKKYLDEFSKNSYYTNAITQMTSWQNMISTYVENADVIYDYDTYRYVKPASDLSKYFENKRSSILLACTDGPVFFTVTFTLNTVPEDMGGYYYRYDRDAYEEENLGSTMTFEVPAGTTIDDLFNQEDCFYGFGYNYDNYDAWSWKESDSVCFFWDEPIYRSMTIYPEWKEKVGITLNANGGEFYYSGSNETSITYKIVDGQEAKYINDTPYKNGYVVAYWAKDSEGTQRVETVHEGETYYAIWKELVLPINYNNDTKTWTFIFDPSYYYYIPSFNKTTEKVYIRGSFNDWLFKNGNEYLDPKYLMTYDSEKDYYYINIYDEHKKMINDTMKFYISSITKWVGYPDGNNIIHEYNDPDSDGNFRLY